MHQTTVRFGEDLWEALEGECAHLGVSIAQYLREAALTRLVYAAGRRGDDEFELALELATGTEPRAELAGAGELELAARPARGIRAAYDRAAGEGGESAALAAQGRLARHRARELRERAARRRQR
jgi:hypothetical protein